MVKYCQHTYDNWYSNSLAIFIPPAVENAVPPTSISTISNSLLFIDI